MTINPHVPSVVFNIHNNNIGSDNDNTDCYIRFCQPFLGRRTLKFHDFSDKNTTSSRKKYKTAIEKIELNNFTLEFYRVTGTDTTQNNNLTHKSQQQLRLVSWLKHICTI